MPENPHFSFPFRRSNGRIAVAEQDSPEEVMTCVQVIAYCPVGALPERPDFGWQQPYMRMQPLDPNPLLGAIQRWEPRAQPTAEEGATIAQEALGISQFNVDVANNPGASE